MRLGSNDWGVIVMSLMITPPASTEEIVAWVELARLYEQAGAAAISILTEKSFFGGAPEHLAQVKAEYGDRLKKIK